MAEAQRPDQQSRHDLVAYAEHRDAFEHAVRESDGRTHGDIIAAEQ